MFINETLNICSPVQSGCAEIGVDGDIIVPDIMPDILKIIQVDGSTSTETKEIVPGKFTCTGKLNLKILYIPESETEKIKSIITAFDFSHVITNGNLTENTIPQISSDVSKVDFQLTNSRKLRIKSVISLNYAFSETETVTVACDTAKPDIMQMQKKSIRTETFDGFKDTQFLVRESLELPSGQMSISEIIKMDVSVSQTDIKTMSGRVILRGTCDVCALYTDEGRVLRHADFEIPFTEIIDMDGVTESSVCEIELYPEQITYHPENDSDDDARIIYTEIVVSASCTGRTYTDMEYIGDFYCPGYRISGNKEYRQLDNIIAEAECTLSVRDTFSMNSGAPEISGIYNLMAKPVIDKVTTEDERVRIEGRLVCYCLYLCSGESPVYSCRKEIGFCETVDVPGSRKGADCSVSAVISHKSSSVNSSGETEIKASVSVKAIVSERVNVPVMPEFEMEKIPDSSKKGIVIYFVQPGDNLWDIAKHYGVPVGDIEKLNKTEDGTVVRGQQLLIPSL